MRCPPPISHSLTSSFSQPRRSKPHRSLTSRAGPRSRVAPCNPTPPGDPHPTLVKTETRNKPSNGATAALDSDRCPAYARPPSPNRGNRDSQSGRRLPRPLGEIPAQTITEKRNGSIKSTAVRSAPASAHLLWRAFAFPATRPPRRPNQAGPTPTGRRYFYSFSRSTSVLKY